MLFDFKRRKMESENKDIDFSKMPVIEIKKFLTERGVSVNGYHKPSLIEIANSVQKMKLPSIESLLCKNSNELQRDGKLLINDMEIENPFKMKVVNSFIDSPPFGLYDIFNHLICHSTNCYDKQGLAAYKSFDDYRLFEDGYVETLSTITLQNEGLLIYVGKVRPAMKTTTDDGKKFYDLYFILEGKGSNRGSVLMAWCACKGGRDGGCKHISAAMYSLEDLLNTKPNDSSTSGPCLWVKRPTSSTQPCEVKKLVIEKGKLPSHKNRKRRHSYVQCIDIDVRDKRDQQPPSKRRLVKFIETLNNICQSEEVENENENKPPVILPLLNKLYESSKSPKQSESELNGGESFVNIESTGILEQKLAEGIKDHPKFIHTPEALVSKLAFTKDETTSVNDLTLKQWKCKEWYFQRAGFITASLCKRVYTRQETVEKNRDNGINVDNLVKNIVQPKSGLIDMPTSPHKEPKGPREWGLVHEESARDAYFRVERHKHHKIQLIAKGFLISDKKLFLGASLDNIRHCECSSNCPNVVVEYKCPWKHRDLDPKEAFLKAEIGGVKVGKTFSLSTKCKYYFQVQCQMFVANLSLCDLVVWTKKGIFTTQVKFNKKFMENVCQKLEKFWMSNVLPVMVQRISQNLNLVGNVKSSSGMSDHIQT